MWTYISESELYHHAIQGQKWGKRHGPPYPLKPGQHSAAEKKAEKYQSAKEKAENLKQKQHTNYRQMLDAYEKYRAAKESGQELKKSK